MIYVDQNLLDLTKAVRWQLCFRTSSKQTSCQYLFRNNAGALGFASYSEAQQGKGTLCELSNDFPVWWSPLRCKWPCWSQKWLVNQRCGWVKVGVLDTISSLLFLSDLSNHFKAGQPILIPFWSDQNGLLLSKWQSRPRETRPTSAPARQPSSASEDLWILITIIIVIVIIIICQHHLPPISTIQFLHLSKASHPRHPDMYRDAKAKEVAVAHVWFALAAFQVSQQQSPRSSQVMTWGWFMAFGLPN